MTQKQREKFLAKAREAEEMAARNTDPGLKAEWLRIAQNYRQLAERVV
jgi:hypothetical protein